MRATACRLAVLALAVFSPLAAGAQTTRTHTVSAILLDGKDVASAAGVTVTPPAGAPQHTIRLHETIPDGTRVDVPARVVVVIVSTGGASTARLEPGASITFVSTGKGEQVRADGGQVFFAVVGKALDFYRVQYGDQIVAGVSGTAFSIAANGKTVTFACTSDQIAVTKTGFLVIGSQRKAVSLVDTISAGQPPVSYRPTQTWMLGTFASYAAAQTAYQGQLAAAQQRRDLRAQANVLNNIGVVQGSQGQYAAALQSYQRSLTLYRQLGDRDGVARAVGNIGNVQEQQSQYAAALQSDQQALAQFRQLGDLAGEAAVLGDIGVVQEDRGQYAAALQSDQQALALFRQVGDRSGEAGALGNAGNVQADQGQIAAALQSYEQALALSRRLGDLSGEARVLDNIGNAQVNQHEFAAALQSYQEAQTLDRQLGDRDAEARVLSNSGIVQAVQQQYAASIDSHEQARALFRQLGDLDGEAGALGDIGVVQEVQGQYAAALQSYQQAMAIYQQIGEHGANVDKVQSNIERVAARLAAPPSPSPQPS
jgi:tetratricopeptide (TPR) repeat protein